MLDRFIGMEILSRIAHLGSFSAAARSLGLSQTMVTKHVTALEDRLAVKLFERSTRGVTLTGAARAYVLQCERILSEIHAAESAVRADKEVVGNLRVECVRELAHAHVLPVIFDFERTYPQVSVIFETRNLPFTGHVAASDVSICIGNPNEPGLVVRKLADTQGVICCAKSYVEKNGRPHTVAELRDHDCISHVGFTDGATTWWQLGRHGEITVPVRCRFWSNDGDALMTAAREGWGLVYVPSFMADDDIRSGKLVVITLDQPTLETKSVYASYRTTSSSPAVFTLVDMLAQRFREGIPLIH